MIPRNSSPRRSSKGSRTGQALVEFAIISFVLTAMLAGFLGLIVLGLGSFQNNIAAESAGRLLDRHQRLSAAAFQARFGDSSINPLTATASDVLDLLTFDEPAFNNDFGEPLFDDRHLVLSPTEWAASATLPELNQLLIPSYVYDPDVVPDGQTEQGAYRYPGAVVERTVGGETYQTVLVPLLSTAGVEVCHDVDCECESQHWVAPLRVCKVMNCDCDVDPPVMLDPIGTEARFRLSIVYPSQPASMMTIEVTRDGSGDIISQVPVTADDSTVPTKYATELGTLPSGYTFADPTPNPDFGATPSRGRYGLGESFAFVKKVRPYRRVFETRSTFRLQAGSMTAHYQADGSWVELEDADSDSHTTETAASPFVIFQDNDDQFLDLGEQVIDREPNEYSLVIPDEPPVGTFNDFRYRALDVPSGGAGTWRLTVAAECQPASGSDWQEDHVLELRLYRNGVREQMIATATISADQAGTSSPVQLIGHSVTDTQVGDIIQVRVYSRRPESATYETQLTGVPETNWITYELLNARN
jgi:hypothetical protein